MAFVRNAALFFVFYLPLTFLVGLVGGFYVGPTQGPDEAYPLFIWVIVAWPLLLPSFLWVPVAHILLRLVARRLDGSRLRMLAVVLVPAGLLGLHLLFWGGVVLGGPLLLLVLLPGALYGLVFRIPRA